MSKAVLVLDEMPKTCEECPLSYLEWSGTDGHHVELRCCPKHHNHIWKTVDPEAEKPDWCPLREMPRREEPLTAINVKYMGAANLNVDYHDGYANGWNACLDALEGKHDRR